MGEAERDVIDQDKTWNIWCFAVKRFQAIDN